MKRPLRDAFNLTTGILFIGFIAMSSELYSQEELQQQFSIQHDNDFLFAIDRYYTAGTFFGHSRKLKNDFIFRSNEENPIQLVIILGQETQREGRSQFVSVIFARHF